MKRSLAVGFLLLVGTLGVGIACSFPSPDLLDVPVVPTTNGPTATDAPSTTTPRPDGSVPVPTDGATDVIDVRRGSAARRQHERRRRRRQRGRHGWPGRQLRRGQ